MVLFRQQEDDLVENNVFRFENTKQKIAEGFLLCIKFLPLSQFIECEWKITEKNVWCFLLPNDIPALH